MNVIGLLFLFLVAGAAIFGLYFVASSPSSGNITDTYGNVLTNSSNATKEVVQSTATTGLSLGGIVLLFIGFLIVLVIIIALVAVAMGKV